MPYLVARPKPASQLFLTPQPSNPWDSNVFYSSLPGGRAKQIVPALFSNTGGMRVKKYNPITEQIF
jgi:hypothetical protein